MRRHVCCGGGRVCGGGARRSIRRGRDAREKAGCPAGWDLMTVERINATITTPGSEQVLIDFDAAGNNDGYLSCICSRRRPPRTLRSTRCSSSATTWGNPNNVVVLDASRVRSDTDPHRPDDSPRERLSICSKARAHPR